MPEVFCCEFHETSKNTLFTEHPWRTAFIYIANFQRLPAKGNLEVNKKSTGGEKIKNKINILKYKI